MKTLPFIAAAFFSLFISFDPAFAQGSAFTYQGRLNDGANPANGNYDFTFSLFNTNAGGSPSAGPITNAAVAVSNGLFTTTLDFGNALEGAARWLEIGVRTNGSVTFNPLSPRQPLTPTPYALFANTASNVVDGAVTSAKLAATGVAAGSYTLATITVDAQGRLTGAGSGALELNGDVAGTLGATVVGKIGGIAPTSANTPNTVVKRDANGNFSGNLQGNVQLGNNTAVANAANAGAIRWSGSNFEYSDGSSWKPVVDAASVPHLAVISGTTASRPASPYDGQLFYNTTAKALNYFNGSQWLAFAVVGNPVLQTVSGAVANGAGLSLAGSFTTFPTVTIWVLASGTTYSNVTGNASYPVSYDSSSKTVTVTNNSGATKSIVVTAVGQ